MAVFKKNKEKTKRMSEKLYTEEELDRAKEYLRQRLENEHSMSISVERWLSYYSELLVSVLWENPKDYEREVDELLEELADAIYDDCTLLAVDEHGAHQDEILAYIDGLGVKERIISRCRTFLGEVASYVGAGLLLGELSRAVVGAIRNNLLSPFEGGLITRAREYVKSGFAEDNGLFDTPHYGRGVPVSSLKGLRDITEEAIGAGFWYNDYMEAWAHDAKGFIPFRGSSFPCDECDSHAGVFHGLDGEAPAYHGHCKCFVVWVY